MNHCIQGGVGDGDGGEDDGEGSEERRVAAAGSFFPGAGSSFPAADIMGERRPFASFLHGFLGALPHGYGIHGGGKKHGFGGCKFVGMGCP